MTVRDTPSADSLPPLYARWLKDLLGGELPEETSATCSDCAMLRNTDEVQSEGRVFFDSRSKCCTFLPVFRNFLAGRVLRDNSPELAEGRISLEFRLASRVAVSPIGIGRPPSYELMYHHSSEGFGRSQSLRCPHYLRGPGRCGVWRHRCAICSTFFCKHDRGAIGFNFWRKAVEPLLISVERELARWCVLELGLGATALWHSVEADEDHDTIVPGELERNINEKAYRLLWDQWAGKERQFFIACAELVDRLRWADIERICGPDVRIFARMTTEAYARLNRTASESALRAGSFRLLSMGNGSVCLSTYSDYDPVEIPIRLLGALQHFSGQPTEQALATIAEQEGIALDSEAVSRLTDFGLLVEPDPTSEAK